MQGSQKSLNPELEVKKKAKKRAWENETKSRRTTRPVFQWPWRMTHGDVLAF